MNKGNDYKSGVRRVGLPKDGREVCFSFSHGSSEQGVVVSVGYSDGKYKVKVGKVNDVSRPSCPGALELSFMGSSE